MTVTLRQIMEAQPALQSLVQQSLPVKQAYHLARLLKTLEPEVQAFQEQRNALIKKHGRERPASEAERPVHGETVVEVEAAQFTIFRERVNELLETEVTLDRPKIALNGSLQMTARDLLVLDPFITVEE